jgi:hypothetical protein
VNARACNRLWEVEAARDGRLTGKALAAFEEHAAVCRQCSRKRRALDALRRQLAGDDTTAVDEIALRRRREKLLAQADSGLRSPASDRSRGVVAGLAMACGVATLIGWATLRPKREPAPRSPIASIVASAGARWERHRMQGLEQVALADGVLSLSIRRSGSDPRVSVHVPDGDIDDVGTSFQVTVEAGHTREIVVREGAVFFRQQGKRALVLTSPTVWVAPPADVEVPAVAAIQSETVIEPAAPPPKPRRTDHKHERHDVDAPAVSPSEATPADEDLAFLNIVALRREGRFEEARVAAGAYVRKFPQGFRRDEVVDLLRETR